MDLEFTAQQARELSSFNARSDDQLSIILKGIRTAAECGRTNLIVNRTIYPSVQESLLRMGYTMRKVDHPFMPTEISW